MKVSSVKFGDVELVESGLFITYPGHETTLTLTVSNEDKVIFNFSFLGKDDGEKHEIDADIHGNILNLKMYNFNNPLGTGSSHPIRIGKFGDRAVYFSYRIYALDKDTDKTFIYSFYSQKEATKTKAKNGSGK